MDRSKLIRARLRGHVGNHKMATQSSAAVALLLLVGVCSSFRCPLIVTSGRRSHARMMCGDELGWLQAKLKVAAEQEDYETAARLRDRINALAGPAPPSAPASPGLPETLSAADFLEQRKRGDDCTVLTVDAAAAPEGGGAAVAEALDRSGVVRIDGALTSVLASELLECIHEALADALEHTRDAPEAGARWQSRFGNVLSRPRRHDAKLSLEAAPVRVALAALLRTLRPALATCLGDDALLYELAALISAPGAVRSPPEPNAP